MHIRVIDVAGEDEGHVLQAPLPLRTARPAGPGGGECLVSPWEPMWMLPPSPISTAPKKRVWCQTPLHLQSHWACKWMPSPKSTKQPLE